METKFSVFVGGTEVNDYLLTRQCAEELAEQFTNDGYNDVHVVNIEICEPLVCPQCGGVNCFKKKADIVCYDCNKITSKDNDVSFVTKSYEGGYDPKVDMGDYIEGTDGVHEYSSSFTLGRS